MNHAKAFRRPALAIAAIAGVLSAGSSTAATPSPDFQVLDLLGTMTITSTTQILTVPTTIRFAPGLPDNPNFVSWNGLARDPNSGEIYVAGGDEHSGDSYLTRVDFTTGAQTLIGTLKGEIVVDLAFDGAGHLYALTDNTEGTHHHSLLALNPATATYIVAKVLDAHGGGPTSGWFGAIAYDPADGYLYYAGNDAGFHLFVDKLAPGTLTQSPVLASGPRVTPTSMAFSQGRLWLAAEFQFYSADAANIAAGLTAESEQLHFSTLVGPFVYSAFGMIPAATPCLPGPTAACIQNRFRIEVAYDATPANGTGAGTVVLESPATVKFTFFDPGNIELIVKMLDACGPFHQWWVFAGGLTNVGVTIKVTDTTNGKVKTYSSTKGQLFQAFADTSAFACN